MDNEEARAVLGEHVERWRACSYDDLRRRIGTPETMRTEGPSGTVYQVELQVFWDAGEGGDLRVIGAIDDGGLRAFKPLTEDFILASDGTFVGE